MTSPPPVPERLATALADRYRIERQLGEGGMATVYLAHDLRHDRPVALKVLRPELAAVMGAERFLAEVRTTANLQHPHILPLFDSGEADGFLFYVMPYVRDESLRERLDREKQLPVAEAVRIARAVAGALDYAHRQGVIHRDIKPANILLQDGQPVVADFGIALAVSAAGGGRLTETGLSLGTPYYMSPEQATADRDPGPASDVYSLACVLYEMIAGDPPHTGSTAQAVLARILTDRPRPLAELRETVPINVEAAVTRALSKVPADRFESAGSFAAALDDPGFTYLSPSDTGSSRGAAPTTSVARPAPRRTVAVLGGLLVVASAAAAWGWLRPGPVAPVQRMRLDVAVSEANGPDVAISPDGTRIVYRSGENTPLRLRPIGSLESQEVPGTEGGRGPVFSPDGRSIAFNQGNPDSWHTVALSGGSPIMVGTRNDPVNAVGAWSDDGFIYYLRDGGTDPGIVRAPSRGGPAERIPAKEVYGVPVAIPGVTDRILAMDAKGGSYGFLDVDDGEYRPLAGLEGATYAAVAGGYVFWRTGDGTLAAAHLDARRERLSSPPVTLAQAVENQGFTVSQTGTLVYLSASEGGQTLVWVDPSGRQEPVDSLLEAAAGAVTSATISPDGRRIALVVGPTSVGDNNGEMRIVVYDIAQATWQQLTFEGTQNYLPRWLPDGRIVFLSDQGGEVGAWVKPADRSAEETLLFRPKTGRLDGGLDVSPVPGGPVVVGMSGVAEGETSGLYLVDPTPGAEPRAFVTSRFNVWAPAVSPDGRWVAYISDESSQRRVYIRPFPGGGPPVPVSLDVGYAPVWGATSAELYYTTGRTLVRARLDLSGGVRVTARDDLPGMAPEQLILMGSQSARYDIDKDGRILAPSRSGVSNSAAAGPGGTLPVVVLNVFREIEERLGGSGGR